MHSRTLVVAGVTLAALLAWAPVVVASREGPPTWQSWHPMRGVVDIGGPVRDGRFVVAAAGRLSLLQPGSGRRFRYPSIGTPYSTTASREPYLAVAGPRQRVSRAHCGFPADTVYALEPAGDPGVLSVSPRGRVRRLVSVSGVASLNGIVFDSAGRFGGRLLVVGLTAHGSGVLVSVDCRGRARVVTSSAPHLEGGLAIAPPGFGAFAGDVLAPDEVDGRLLALAPDGSVHDVVDPGQLAGPDIGIESIGVVPSGNAAAYLADRRSPGNANPGHDTVLRLGEAALRRMDVLPGDLLAALEGGGTTIDVRCTTSCTVRVIAIAPTGAHPEGQVAFAR